jgi:hypothetical protein
MTKKEKNRMAYLRQKCLDDQGNPLPDADIGELSEMSELIEKSKDVPVTPKKEPKPEVPEIPGCQYMGSFNGVPHYLREYEVDGYAPGSKKKTSEAFRMEGTKKVLMGKRFGDRLLAKLKK